MIQYLVYCTAYTPGRFKIRVERQNSRLHTHISNSLSTLLAMTQRQTSEAGVGWGLVRNLHTPSDIYSLPPSIRLPHFRKKSVAILQAHHLSPAGPPHRNIPAVLSRHTTSPTWGHRLPRPQHQIRFTNAAVHCTIWVHRLPRLPYLIRFTNDAVHCTGSASPTPSFQICFPEPIIDRPRSASSMPTPTATAAPPPSSTWPTRMPSMTTWSRRRGNQTPSPLHVLVCYHRRFKHVLVN